MIAHVVLFRPRSDLAPSARTELAAALEAALQAIPSIRRARVGTRIADGPRYETLIRADYTHAAVLEFDDVPGLKAYLEHPTHQRLASCFFETFEDALIYDFDLFDLENGAAELLDRL